MTAGGDQPTEPLRPRNPIVREHEVEAGYEPAADSIWLARIDDRLRSLTVWVALIGIVALAGLGLAIYDLTRINGALDDRISRLESRSSSSNGASSGQVAEKADKEDVQRLADQVSQVRSSVSRINGRTSSTSSSIDQLSTRIDRLTQQVADLQSSSSSSSTSTSTTTTP